CAHDNFFDKRRSRVYSGAQKTSGLTSVSSTRQPLHSRILSRLKNEDSTMQDNPNTENPPIETEAWEIALKPYATDADAAFDLARRLMEVKRYLKAKPPNPSL